MSRRIDVELTSDRGDGTWSWRAAGAKQPKGVLDADLLYDGAQVGDVVRAEADFDIEGITVVAVQPPRSARQEPERIEVIGSERTFTPVTSSLTGKARERAERGEDDRPRRGRGDRDRSPRPGGPPRDGGRGPRPGGDRAGRPPRERPAPPAPKPKPKKLRPARVHRDALLASLSPEQQPVAEQLLRGGMPAVRSALEEQNAKAKAEGGLEMPADTVLAIAEQLVARTRVADWLDRAEAAKATGPELALRDLRSVVTSADDVARDESTRELAAELKVLLQERTAAEHAEWVADIEGSLKASRVVRALRLSSRAPDPSSALSPELTERLVEAANGALTADIAPDRWATVLDAVAYSPVRRSVTPAGIPAEPTEELLAAVRKHAGRTPAIAALFGVEPPPDRSKGAKRPSKAAGRNPNLSRAGGPRGATVPVPGRPGGAPVAPGKRIPPPPGRQIGATLPGAPPPGAAPQTPDPTAPLAPPSADGIAEPVTDDAVAPAVTATEASWTQEATPETSASPTPATDPLAAPAAEAGAAGEAGQAEEPQVAPTEAAAPTAEAAPAPDATSATDPLVAPAAEAGAAEPVAEPELSAPADSSLPEPAPTATEEATGSPEAAEDVVEAPSTEARDALVSEEAEGPFEPPADPPVEGAGEEPQPG